MKPKLRMPGKKFRVRVKHYARDKYKIEYCHYRFIPAWRTIYFWFEQSVTGSTHCWSTELMCVRDAEAFAASLKSMNDVNRYYETENKKRQDFYDRREKYFKEATPYDSKDIH